MTEKEMKYRWAAAASKPKAMTVSEKIHNQEVGIPYHPGDLRDYLVQRVMARHGFTEEQALAEILAFGG
jgi:hypothetical protein